MPVDIRRCIATLVFHEALKGDRSGFYSVRVNEQYRITFRFQGGHADAVACEDYH